MILCQSSASPVSPKDSEDFHLGFLQNNSIRMQKDCAIALNHFDSKLICPRYIFKALSNGANKTSVFEAHFPLYRAGTKYLILKVQQILSGNFERVS